MNNLSTEKPISVLIPDGENDFALPVLRCLGQMQNVKTYVLSNDPWALSRFSRYKTSDQGEWCHPVSQQYRFQPPG